MTEATEKKQWLRHRFRANVSDYRPIAFPPPGPYWCTGYGDDYSIIVVYMPEDGNITDWWPEAHNIDTEEVDEIVYTSRFPKPDWYVDPDTAALEGVTFTAEEVEMIAAPWSYITPSGEALTPAAEPAAPDRLDGIARKLQSKAAGYVSDARLVGNVTAEDIVDLCNAFLDRQPQAAPAAAPAPDELPPKVGHILRLAEIIREVDGTHDKGAAALAEAILSHPGIAEVLPTAPAATPGPAPAGSLRAVVKAAMQDMDLSSPFWENQVDAAIAAVAEWLERHHTDRIANGSQFADLLREALEREAGR
jgi:hypothetical protein